MLERLEAYLNDRGAKTPPMKGLIYINEGANISLERVTLPGSVADGSAGLVQLVGGGEYAGIRAIAGYTVPELVYDTVPYTRIGSICGSKE